MLGVSEVPAVSLWGEGKGRENSALLFVLNLPEQYQISKMKAQPQSMAFSLSISSHSFEDCE